MTARLSLAALIALCAPPALAETRMSCAPRDAVVERLNSAYGETRRAVGIGGNNTMMEVFASEDSGSWTITVTMPTGMTCLIASGDSFEDLDTALQPTGTKL